LFFVVLDLKLSSFIYHQHGVNLSKEVYPHRLHKIQQYFDTLLRDDLESLIADWLYELEENATLLQDENYATHFSSFKHNFSILNQSLRTLNHSEFVKRCDAYYTFFCQSLQNELKIQSQSQPLKISNLKYVDQKSSGVFLKVNYANNHTSKKEVGPLLEGGLAIKTPSQKNELASHLIKQFNGLGFKKECINNLKRHISDNKNFHAEERWFGEYFHSFFSSLTKNKLEQFMLEEFDLQWIWHLNTYPTVIPHPIN